MKREKRNVVLSLSGGMDSSTLLLRCIKEYDNVIAIGFDYGQKHNIELERSKNLVKYLWKKGYSVKHQIIRLEGLESLLHSTLVNGGEDVPEGHYAEKNMVATVVPNRNKIFSSIVQSAALSLAMEQESTCDIALGIHSGDHTIYPDCRQEFRDIDHKAFLAGNWEGERVHYYTPYLEGDKFTILQDGESLCKDLGLSFEKVYKNTNTSYKPIKHKGVWYSDAKSASSVERVEAFIKLGRPDPAKYADEKGPIEWKEVVKRVEKVLEQ